LQGEGKKEERGLRFREKNNTIKKRSHFDEIFRKGKRTVGSTISIVFTEEDSFKFGITFKRDAKSAVQRNKAKRRIRHLVRNGKLKLRENINIVFILSGDSLSLTFKELSSELRKIIEDAEITE